MVPVQFSPFGENRVGAIKLNRAQQGGFVALDVPRQAVVKGGPIIRPLLIGQKVRVDKFPDLPVGLRGAALDDKIKLLQFAADMFDQRRIAVDGGWFHGTAITQKLLFKTVAFY